MMRSQHKERSDEGEKVLSQQSSHTSQITSITSKLLGYDESDAITNGESNYGNLRTMATNFWKQLWIKQKQSIDLNMNAGKRSTAANKYDPSGNTLDIINELGDSWELCRPCSDVEMIENFCTSDIGNVVDLFIVYYVELFFFFFKNDDAFASTA